MDKEQLIMQSILNAGQLITQLRVENLVLARALKELDREGNMSIDKVLSKYREEVKSNAICN